MSEFEKLSQQELICLATALRVDYKHKINKGLYSELNSIVHHQEKRNPYNGTWTPKKRNYVIYQIFYQIIPKEERISFIKKHPLEKVNESLKENLKERDKLVNFYSLSDILNQKENAKLQKELRSYDSLEKKDTKEIGELLHNSREELLMKSSYLTHLSITILQPLVARGWVLEEHLKLPNHPSGWRAVDNGPVHMDELLCQERIYDGHGIPFEGIRNEDILYNHLPPYRCVNSLRELNQELLQKVKEIQEKNKNLEKDNKNLEKDNEFLKNLIRKNNIDI